MGPLEFVPDFFSFEMPQVFFRAFFVPLHIVLRNRIYRELPQWHQRSLNVRTPSLYVKKVVRKKWYKNNLITWWMLIGKIVWYKICYEFSQLSDGLRGWNWDGRFHAQTPGFRGWAPAGGKRLRFGLQLKWISETNHQNGVGWKVVGLVFVKDVCVV